MEGTGEEHDLPGGEREDEIVRLSQQILTKPQRRRQQRLEFPNPRAPANPQVRGGPGEENEENKRMLLKVSHPASNNQELQRQKVLGWRCANSTAAKVARTKPCISVRVSVRMTLSAQPQDAGAFSPSVQHHAHILVKSVLKKLYFPTESGMVVHPALDETTEN